MYDWEVIAATVAGIGSVVVGLPRLVRGLKAAYKKLRYNMFGINDLRTDVAALTEQVAFIVSELKPNGGQSQRDCLDRIEERQVLYDQRQWAILSDMSVGVFETNKDGEFTKVKRKFLRMTGRTPEEVKGSGWVNTVAMRDRKRVESEWLQAIAEERELETVFLMITPDDERMQVSARTYKMIGQDGRPLGFLGMLAPLD